MVQLNSAWASGPNDEVAKLLVGEAQVRAALDEAAGAGLKVGLVHHPVADLRDFDRERLETLLAAPGGLDFLLRGHLHRQRTQALHSPDGRLVELAAGAAYTDRPYRKGYLLADADLGAGAAVVRFFTFSGQGRGFWTADLGAYEGLKDGVWRFALAPHLRLGGAAVAAPSPEQENRRRLGAVAGYRAAAARVHGTVRFIGLADSSPRRHVPVADVYVPLRLHPRKAGEKARSWTTPELLRRLLQPAKKGAARVVVLGDPGSGKTTLCRFAAQVIAGAAQVPEVEVHGEPLPLLLPFRDYVRQCRESGDRDLLTYLYEQARNHLQQPLPEGLLEQVLERGEAVLLLDGLDEVGEAGERASTVERITAFLGRFPRLPALLTSRIAGYDQAPLADRGADACQHLELQPFTNEDQARFVTAWYQAQEPDDPVAREHGMAELSAALASDPRVRELARNPMLATLIALVHRYEARLPGERAKLYELCVKTLLETWPAAKKREFREIDEGRQRAYLEELALRMQGARVDDEDREVTIARRELLTAFSEIVHARGESAEPPETLQRRLERWLTFLAEGTGLLVEQRPGVFGFFHLSLLEYLAARGLERRETPLEEALAGHYDVPTWREVCLLAVGWRATDKAFLDRLYRHIVETADPERWLFLLRCLREEADFDDAQRAELMTGATRYLLELEWWQWEATQQLFDQLLHLSLRHRTWVAAWLQEQLQISQRDQLQVAVILGGEQQAELLETLEGREDRPVVVASLLDFWPGEVVGCWAAEVASPAMARTWAGSLAGELVPDYALTGLRAPTRERLAPALVAAVVHTASAMAALAGATTERIRNQPRDGVEGSVASWKVSPVGLEIRGQPAWPGSGPWLSIGVFARDFDRYLARDFGKQLARDFDQYSSWSVSNCFPHNSIWNLPIDTALYFSRDLAREFTREFIRHSNRNLSGFFARYSSRYFALNFSRYFARDLLAEAMSYFHNDELNPQMSTLSPDLEVREAVRGSRKKSAKEYVRWYISRLFGEAWTALATTAGCKRTEAAAYAHRRLWNAWLLHVWPGVDDALEKDPEPGSLALYLALGWTQASTTSQWPATPRWRALLGGEPPAHWLPRSQWHGCWLLFDNENAEHRQGLRAALDEGRQDPEWGPEAEELGRLMGG